jgi:hypothetical protein
MSVTDPLIEFIRARLDEDEAIAQRNTGDSGLSDGLGYPDYRTYTDDDTAAADAFIHHFPASRMLRAVEAKRRIVNWCAEVVGGRDLSEYGSFGLLRDDSHALAVTLAVETLRNLTSEWSDHPDYRKEWAA